MKVSEKRFQSEVCTGTALALEFTRTLGDFSKYMNTHESYDYPSIRNFITRTDTHI